MLKPRSLVASDGAPLSGGRGICLQFAIDFFHQVFVAQALPPDVFGFIQSFGIRQVVAVQRVRSFGREIEFFRFQQMIHVIHMFFQPVQ